MGLLGVLHLARVDPRLGREVVRPVLRGDEAAGGGDGGIRQRHRVGAHIRDEAAFIELLGGRHRPPRSKAQLAPCLLLER